MTAQVVAGFVTAGCVTVLWVGGWNWFKGVIWT